VEKVVHMLIKAKKPIIVAGDGIFWSKASGELRELVELLSIPVITRRMGRGAVPEEHPLAFGGGFRRPIQMQSDLVVIIGLRMNTLEGFGLPPRYPENVKYVQIAEDQEELTTRLLTEYSISGSPKQVLRQMINFARDLKAKPDRHEWLAFVTKEKEADRVSTKAAVDKDATAILDGLTMSGFFTDKFKSTFAGQLLDGATWAGVGHSVGMAIGAQLG
jgi:acetolactate synthase-1/2/3 large subunit